MKNDTLNELLAAAKTAYEFTKDRGIAVTIAFAEAELASLQRDISDDPITIMREDMDALNWPAKIILEPDGYGWTEYSCPADRDLIVEFVSDGARVMFRSGRSIEGVKTVDDLIDFARLLTGKGIAK